MVQLLVSMHPWVLPTSLHNWSWSTFGFKNDARSKAHGRKRKKERKNVCEQKQMPRAWRLWVTDATEAHETCFSASALGYRSAGGNRRVLRWWRQRLPVMNTRATISPAVLLHQLASPSQRPRTHPPILTPLRVACLIASHCQETGAQPAFTIYLLNIVITLSCMNYVRSQTPYYMCASVWLINPVPFVRHWSPKVRGVKLIQCARQEQGQTWLPVQINVLNRATCDPVAKTCTDASKSPSSASSLPKLHLLNFHSTCWMKRRPIKEQRFWLFFF